MKCPLPFYFLLLILSSCQQNSDQALIEGSWILSDQVAKPNAGFIRVIQGTLLHFTRDSLFISNVFTDEMLQGKYSFDNGYLMQDTFRIGKIRHLSKDSLIIEQDSLTFDLFFTPLPPSHLSLAKEKLYKRLIDNIWELKTPVGKYRFYLDSLPYHGASKANDQAKHLLYELEVGAEKYLSNYARWTLKSFRGSFIFGFSSNQFEQSFFQISYFNKDSIRGTVHHHFSSDQLEATMHLKRPEANQLLKRSYNKICGTWTLDHLIAPNHTVLHNQIKANDIVYGSSNPEQENRISLADLETPNIKMEFQKDGHYTIYAGQKVIKKGSHWGLLKDGKYLYMDHKMDRDHLIKIEASSATLLEIKKYEEININLRNQYLYEWLHLRLRRD